jgi:hypothetical protein
MIRPDFDDIGSGEGLRYDADREKACDKVQAEMSDKIVHMLILSVADPA